MLDHQPQETKRKNTKVDAALLDALKAECKRVGINPDIAVEFTVDEAVKAQTARLKDMQPNVVAQTLLSTTSTIESL